MTMLQDLRKQLTELFEMVEWGGERYGQECCPTCLGFKNPPLGDLSGYGSYARAHRPARNEGQPNNLETEPTMELTKEQVQKKLIGILEDQLGVTADEVELSSDIIEDLGSDSLDVVELLMAVEDEFGIHIDDEEAEKARTVQQALELVFTKLK